MTMLPLYQNADARHERENPNAGLLFERFFNQFNDDASKILESKEFNGKLTQGNNFWLQNFKKAGDTGALQKAAYRQMDLVKQLNGKHKFFNTQWHFVTGTGYPYPVENGLLWHRVHGVPYLSGAAVKGLVRAWVEQWAEFDSEEKRTECLLNWFGSDNKIAKKQQYPSQAGDLIFFDALPVKEVTLVTDIMTPHCGKWYSEGRKIENIATEPEKVPADWHDPVPIPFLVVDKATSYLFSIAPRNVQAAERVDMKEVIDCLTQALEWLGAGAKTATGYGGFIKQENHPLEKEWKAENQSLDEELKEWSKEQLINAFSRDYTATKTRFEQNWQQVLALIWHYHESEINEWENSKDKNPKKAYKKLTEDKGQL
ncbi:MAG: type III-B CRISPR module RAMP protein Cmr6 [Methylococcales bacterium]|nr:type III-B CRISPR module RAMP protein Cmr6 [Methylococcales bacterium]